MTRASDLARLIGAGATINDGTYLVPCVLMAC